MRWMMTRTPKSALANHHMYLTGATVAAPTMAERTKRMPSPTTATTTDESDLAIRQRVARIVCDPLYR